MFHSTARYTGSTIGSALCERNARSNQRLPSGSAIKSSVFAAMVVSSFFTGRMAHANEKARQQQGHAENRAAPVRLAMRGNVTGPSI